MRSPAVPRPALTCSAGGRDSIGQGIRDAELLPLEEAQRVVGQYLYPLHRLEGREELCGLPQAVFVVRQAGDEDMAYPERYAEVGDVARIARMFALSFPVSLRCFSGSISFKSRMTRLVDFISRSKSAR